MPFIAFPCRHPSIRHLSLFQANDMVAGNVDEVVVLRWQMRYETFLCQLPLIQSPREVKRQRTSFPLVSPVPSLFNRQLQGLVRTDRDLLAKRFQPGQGTARGDLRYNPPGSWVVKP